VQNLLKCRYGYIQKLITIMVTNDCCLKENKPYSVGVHSRSEPVVQIIL